ncbi:hypothetical protein Mapa_013022 [Marchantia paleacea]|nr:hypothetical protein Mapa_013022 [Marchantia paleacea]
MFAFSRFLQTIHLIQSQDQMYASLRCMIFQTPNDCKDKIEAAGASIVSHGAELETQGMDAVGKTDKEPDLLVALQDLLQNLQGEAGPGDEPVESLRDLTDPKYGDFFTPHASPSTNMEWRNQERLRVLAAIGTCNTLQTYLIDPVSGWRVGGIEKCAV